MKLPLRFSYCILFSLVMLLGGPGWAQVPAFDWAAGGEKPNTYEQQMQNRGIAVDAAGNTYVTGTFRRTLTLGSTTLTSAGDYDVFVAKLDASGNYLWAVRAGGRGEDISNGIAVDADGNVHIAGFTRSDLPGFGALSFTNLSYGSSLFVAKLSTKGDWLRALQAGGPRDTYIQGSALAVDRDGAVYVTGTYRGDVNFGSNSLSHGAGYGVFVAKMDPAGAWKWAVQAESNGYDFGNGIALDGSGNAYVTGSFEGNSIRFGATTLFKAGASRNLFVAKLDAAGTWAWATQASTIADAAGRGIAVDRAGNAYITGYIVGTSARLGAIELSKNDQSSDLLVAKLDASGNWKWAVRGGGTGDDFGTAISLDAEDHVTVAGSFTGSSASFGSLPALASSGNADVVVAQLGITGSWRWALRGGGPGADYAAALAQDAAGNSHIAGSFEGASIELGATALPGGATYYGNYADRGFVAHVVDLSRRSTTELMLWPNPSTGPVWATHLEPGQPVQVFDAMGRLVAADARPLFEASGLALPQLAAGVYVVRCGTQARRLVLE